MNSFGRMNFDSFPKKFCENPKRANLNSFTKLLADVPKSVDNFHFRNHVDPWCHKHCNPKDFRSLDGINTESCEQTFKWTNKFTAVKSMNESRFWMFFTLIFDLHNLQKQDKLRSMAHPKSHLRWELLGDLQDWESTLLGTKDTLDDLATEMSSLTVKDPLDDFECLECGAKYKKPWTLKAHINKKHAQEITCRDCNLDFKDVQELEVHMASHNKICNICDKVFSSEWNLQRHIKIHDKIFVCEECKEVFLDKKSFTEHQKLHLVCNICKKHFGSKTQLKRHIMTH